MHVDWLNESIGILNEGLNEAVKILRIPLDNEIRENWIVDFGEKRGHKVVYWLFRVFHRFEFEALFHLGDAVIANEIGRFLVPIANDIAQPVFANIN